MPIGQNVIHNEGPRRDDGHPNILENPVGTLSGNTENEHQRINIQANLTVNKHFRFAGFRKVG